MNTPRGKNEWNAVKTKLKRTHPQLTNADLTYVKGKESKMVDRLQTRLGKSRIEVAWLWEEAFAKRPRASAPAFGTTISAQQ
jgi:hypothetical protein